MIFLGRRFVVTVRHGEGSPLHDVRLDLEGHPDLLSIGPSSVLYAIADRIVDDYVAVIDGIAVDVEEVEAEVFSGAASNPAERIYRLKREVLGFRRAAGALVGPIQRLSSKQTGLPIDPRTGEYFRDVHDHLLRDVERIGSFDDLLTNALQANLAQVAMRDNRDMRRISAWVAIIAVPTMVFGLYGMNFEHMPELGWTYGYPAVVAAVLIICAVLYRRFKHAGWL
jgi:magnesium transporter